MRERTFGRERVGEKRKQEEEKEEGNNKGKEAAISGGRSAPKEMSLRQGLWEKPKALIFRPGVPLPLPPPQIGATIFLRGSGLF